MNTITADGNIEMDGENTEACREFGIENLSDEDRKVHKLCELGYTLEQDDERLHDALKSFTRALEVAPTNAFANLAFASFVIRKYLPGVAESQDLQEKVISSLDIASRILGDSENGCFAFEKSIEMDPENVDALYNYGNFLDQALGDVNRSSELYEKVLSLSPDHVTAMNNYAAQLVEQGKAMNGNDVEAQRLFDRARDLFERANNLSPGLPAFNLACVASLQGHGDKAQFWLEESLKMGLIDPGEEGLHLLMEDPDLENIRSEMWFQKLCDDIRRQNNSLQSKQKASTSSINFDFDYTVEFSGESIFLKQPDSLVDDKVKCKDSSMSFSENLGTTGWTIWNANFVTLRYLEKKGRNWWRGKHVLDLSAGLGLVGIACAKLGAKVTISEVGRKQLECIRNNVSMNQVEENVRVVELAWGDSRAINMLFSNSGQDKEGCDYEYDLVIASDLIYIAIRDSIQEQLVNTLERLVEKGAKRLLLVYEERIRPEEEKILQMLTKNQNLHLFQHPESDICLKDVYSNKHNSSDSDDDCSENEKGGDGGFGLEALLEEELTFQMYSLSSSSGDSS